MTTEGSRGSSAIDLKGIWSQITGGIIARKQIRRVVTMAQPAAKKNAKTKTPVSKTPAKKAPVSKTSAKKAPVSKTPAKKVPAKKAPVKKASSSKTPAKKAPAKKAPVKKAPAKKAPVKKAPVKKAPAKKALVKKAPVKKVPAKKAAPVKKSPASPTSKVKAPVKPVSGKLLSEKGSSAKTASPKPEPAKVAPVPVKKAAPKPAFVKPPVPGKKPPSKDGIVASRDFDLTFLRSQRNILLEERAHLLGQADRLDSERERLIEEAGMGDDQFDEDGGEGDTMAVERERDRVLSDQARQTVEEIDAALARIESGDYGYSVVSTRPIPRERLEVIPWATELVEERVGWIGRR